MKNGRIASFVDLGAKLGREIPENRKGKKMNTATQQKPPLPEYKAVTKYYNHNKRYGFVFVFIPASTVLEFDVETSEKDDAPGTRYQKGETADRELIIEAFIHGSVIERSGYATGLSPEEELVVKITENEKGIQVVWTPNKDGTRPRSNNSPRTANAFLKFVPAIVKIYKADRNFGFVRIQHNSETGEPLKDTDGNPVEIEAHFNKVTLDRARYTGLEEGMEVHVKYFTREDGRSSVAQFRYPDATKVPSHLIKQDEEEAA